MALASRSTDTQTVSRVRMAVALTPRNDAGARRVAQAARYQDIGSLQALALAVAGAVVTPPLLWLAL